MKKINILKENKDFKKIINAEKPFKFKGFIVYKENTNNIYKFGISVSKKIGNAVVRNKIKRQVREIISKNNYEKNFFYHHRLDARCISNMGAEQSVRYARPLARIARQNLPSRWQKG